MITLDEAAYRLLAADAAVPVAQARCDAAYAAVHERLRVQGERQRQRQGFVGVAAEWLDDSPEARAIRREKTQSFSALLAAKRAVEAAEYAVIAAVRNRKT